MFCADQPALLLCTKSFQFLESFGCFGVSRYPLGKPGPDTKPWLTALSQLRNICDPVLLLISGKEKTITLVFLVSKENVCCSREQSWLVEDAAVRFRHSIAPTCPTPRAVSCPSLYPWHLVAMKQVPSLACLSVIFVIFPLVRKQKWAMKTRIKALRPWRNRRWITWIFSRSCHQGAAEITTVRGWLWWGWSEMKLQCGEGKWLSCCWFLIKVLLWYLSEELGAVELMDHSHGLIV